jgi:hypothetical protein
VFRFRGNVSRVRHPRPAAAPQGRIGFPNDRDPSRLSFACCLAPRSSVATPKSASRPDRHRLANRLLRRVERSDVDGRAGLVDGSQIEAWGLYPAPQWPVDMADIYRVSLKRFYQLAAEGAFDFAVLRPRIGRKSWSRERVRQYFSGELRGLTPTRRSKAARHGP